MKDYVPIRDPELKNVSPELKIYLDNKRVDAAKKVLELLQNLTEPTTISHITRMTGVSKPLVVRIVMKSLNEDGNPYGIGVKRVGSYDVIWRKEVKHESNRRESGTQGGSGAADQPG